MKIIIDEFIESLKERQASANTLASYERDIVQFDKYFESKNKKMLVLNCIRINKKIVHKCQIYIRYIDSFIQWV